MLTLDRIETELTVVGFTDGQATPGAPTQQQIDALDFEYRGVIALQYTNEDQVDLAAADANANTTTITLEESFNASPGYQAITTTLDMIQVFLYMISALVVGAFFSVWTIQRKQEIPVLRASGAPVRYLLHDGRGQALLSLGVFTALGVGLGIGMGAAMPAGMPFVLEFGPIAVAADLTILLRLVGAGKSTLRITRVDPLTALEENR